MPVPLLTCEPQVKLRSKSLNRASPQTFSPRRHPYHPYSLLICNSDTTPSSLSTTPIHINLFRYLIRTSISTDKSNLANTSTPTYTDYKDQSRLYLKSQIYRMQINSPSSSSLHGIWKNRTFPYQDLISKHSSIRN